MSSIEELGVCMCREATESKFIESWIWTSIADSRVFWTQTTDMFAATFQSHRLHRRWRHFAKTGLEISKLRVTTLMHRSCPDAENRWTEIVDVDKDRGIWAGNLIQ